MPLRYTQMRLSGKNAWKLVVNLCWKINHNFNSKSIWNMASHKLKSLPMMAGAKRNIKNNGIGISRSKDMADFKKRRPNDIFKYIKNLEFIEITVNLWVDVLGFIGLPSSCSGFLIFNQVAYLWSSWRARVSCKAFDGFLLKLSALSRWLASLSSMKNWYSESNSLNFWVSHFFLYSTDPKVDLWALSPRMIWLNWSPRSIFLWEEQNFVSACIVDAWESWYLSLSSPCQVSSPWLWRYSKWRWSANWRYFFDANHEIMNAWMAIQLIISWPWSQKESEYFPYPNSHFYQCRPSFCYE